MKCPPPITIEMLAAGLEAMREARADCLDDAELVQEIYLAMYGMAYFEPQVWH